MECKEYAKIVKDMREAQKQYFSNRSPFFLNQAKALERMVDAATEEMLVEKKQDPQTSLF